VVESILDNRIRSISTANQGVSVARNHGIKLASYTYVAFLDADDTWEPAYLQVMAELIAQCPEAILFGAAFDISTPKKKISRHFYLPDNFRGYIQDYFQHAIQRELFWTSAVAAKKSNLIRLGGFNEGISYGEDTDLWIRLALDGKTAFANTVLSHYRLVIENSAFLSHHPFGNKFIAHTSQYKPFESQNHSFRKYINLYRWSKIPDMFNATGITPDECRQYLALIDSEVLPLKAKLFLMLPLHLKRWLTRHFNKK
jgi:glycosyltransferase involved in cell wall biosynthesis